LHISATILSGLFNKRTVLHMIVTASTSFNRYLHWFTHPAFGLVWLVLIMLSYLFADTQIAYFFYDHANPTTSELAQDITTLGVVNYYLFIFLGFYFIGLFVLKNQKFANKALYLFLCILLPAMVCDGLKMILGRARPTLLFHQNIYGFQFLKFHHAMMSFPSGHATTIAALMTGLSFLKPRFWGYFLLIAWVVAFTRIFITAHYLSDVMAGWYIGTLGPMLLYYYFERHHWLNPGKL